MLWQPNHPVSARSPARRRAHTAEPAALLPALIFTALALTALTLTACGGQKAGNPVPDRGAGATWRWRAESMKVSALTTPFPATATTPASLDIRISFFDSEGDETKAVGVLTVSVLSAGHELARQEVSFTDERRHHEHWDSVTETYTVTVGLGGAAEPRPDQTLEVRAVFEGEDGSLMRASRDLHWPTQEPTQ